MHTRILSAEHVCKCISKPVKFKMKKNESLSFMEEKGKQIICLQVVSVLYKFDVNYFFYSWIEHIYIVCSCSDS